MATAAPFLLLQEKFLTCDICWDIYDDPRFLPCLHSFCRECLSHYIEAKEGDIGIVRKGGFPCPVCRDFTMPPFPDKPILKWASQFKSNFYITALMSILNMKCKAQRVSDIADNDDMRWHNPPAAVNTSAPYSGENNREIFDFIPTEDFSFILPPVVGSLTGYGTTVPKSCMRQQTPKNYKQVNRISCAMDGDRSGQPKLIGMCVLDVDTVVVADYENSSVKTFRNWRSEINGFWENLRLNSKPVCVTKLSGTTVAVSSPTHRRIYMISVDPILETIQIVRTGTQYRSIAATGQNTIVACYVINQMRAFIDLISLDGSVIQRIASRMEVLEPTLCMTPSGCVLVTDDLQKTVMCVTQDGQGIFRYKPEGGLEFENLQSVSCDFSGRIYLCDFSRGRVVRIITSGGFPTQCELLLSRKDGPGMDQPKVIHVLSDGTIYVAGWDGYLSVFQPQ